jgi:hypothetical protein
VRSLRLNQYGGDGIVDCLKPDEQLAAEVLVSRLGGRIDPKDVGDAQATHDFDLVLPDARIAVEVTAATDEDMERLRGASERPYPAPALAATWWVRLPKNPELELKPLMHKLEPLLAVLEQHSVVAAGRTVQQTPENPEAAEAARSIARLRVDYARRLGAPEPGEDACLALAFRSGPLRAPRCPQHAGRRPHQEEARRADPRGGRRAPPVRVGTPR